MKRGKIQCPFIQIIKFLYLPIKKINVACANILHACTKNMSPYILQTIFCMQNETQWNWLTDKEGKCQEIYETCDEYELKIIDALLDMKGLMYNLHNTNFCMHANINWCTYCLSGLFFWSCSFSILFPRAR